MEPAAAARKRPPKCPCASLPGERGASAKQLRITAVGRPSVWAHHCQAGGERAHIPQSCASPLQPLERVHRSVRVDRRCACLLGEDREPHICYGPVLLSCLNSPSWPSRPRCRVSVVTRRCAPRRHHNHVCMFTIIIIVISSSKHYASGCPALPPGLPARGGSAPPPPPPPMRGSCGTFRWSSAGS